MPARVFVDTNIWLYALTEEAGDIRHQQAASAVLQLERPVINSQVIREACSNLLKKSSLSEERLCALVRDWYRDCEVFGSTAEQHLLASDLRKRNAFSYWDSLIVAAALDAGCSTLLSEDMQNGRVIDKRLTIINPFQVG